MTWTDSEAARREVDGSLGPDTGHTRLRLALAGLGLDDAVSRLDEHQVAALVASALMSDRLRLGGPAQSPTLLAQGTKPQSAAPAPAPAAARAPAAAPAPAPAAGPELDVAAMVQVLLDAARDGVPFCEECAKAAAASAA
jgi:hypothetical protein